MATDPLPLLDVSGLSVEFRHLGADGRPEFRKVVSDLSLLVACHETVALVGGSGSGKSVTSLAIMRLLDPLATRVSGQVMFRGTDLVHAPENDMRAIRGNRISMIFQEPMTSLNPVFTIGRQVAEAIVAHRGVSMAEARNATAQLFDRVRIPSARSRLDDYPHNFSGGMRQRVLIAMALACQPQLLIADEPTTALDVTIQSQILELLKELQAENGMSMLFITHDMGVVAEVADRVAVIFKGELVETGPTDRIFTRQEHPYTRALISAVPRLGSMTGHAMPRRFAVVDTRTGEATAERESTDTIRKCQTPVLQVKNLVKHFGVHKGVRRRVTALVRAVDDVSFDLMPGETLALVGESGCGKSTTGRALLSLTPPTSGQVWFEGVDLVALSPEAMRQKRRQLQMIFQDPYASLNPRMSVGDAIAEPIVMHGEGNRSVARDRAADLLQRVGLTSDMADRYPHQFSGGQRQRISIARALALNPRVIVADEAVSALDVTVKAQVVNLMLDLQEEFGLSYLFISHDMAVVERISHRVAVMYLGEIVEIGPRAAIFANPGHSYTRRLLDAVPVPEAGRRHLRRPPSNDEIKSAVRPLSYKRPRRTYSERAPGHFVMTE